MAAPTNDEWRGGNEGKPFYYSANIFSVNRFADFPYEKLRKNHADVYGGVIIGNYVVEYTFNCRFSPPPSPHE